jgi:uncharacterized membrane protein
VLKITLAQGYSLTTMLAVAGGAILLAGLFYWRAFRTLRTGQRLALLGLRAVAIVIVVLLLFRPVFTLSKDVEDRPGLVFLLDRSASMGIADDPSGASRFQRARQQIEKWWEKLRGDFDLHLIEFAEEAKLLKGPQEAASLTADGKATSLPRALLTAAQLFPPQKVQAIILLSDGINNATGNPVDTAAKLETIVHTVGVGASLRDDTTCRDVQVAGIDCADRMLLNNKAHINAAIQSIGLTGRGIQVILEEDGKQIGQADLTLASGETPQQVPFDFTPTVKGQHTYTVRAVPLPEEKILENNQRSAMAVVIEPGLKVLYLEGTLRAEYGALVDRFLAKDPDLEFCALVQTRPNVFLRRSNIAGLDLTAIPKDQETVDKFDVFILGDLDHTYLHAEQQERIVKRVRAGAGLIMLGGYHSLGPGGYANDPIGQILPMWLGAREIGQVTEPFLPVLTPDGGQHPIFANIRDFFPTRAGPARVAGLPKLDGCTRIAGIRPGAVALAMLGEEPGSMPVLAVQSVERGRTAVFCGDTTRNWQQGPRALNRDTPFLRFWGQTVRWLAGRSAPMTTGASIAAETDKAMYEPDEPIHISATVRDQQGQAPTTATVTAKIRMPDGKKEDLTLAAVSGPAGHYGATLPSRLSGKYEIFVEAKLADVKLVADRLVPSVGRPNLEFEKLDLDDKTLTAIAAAAHGRYVHITTADHLLESLDRTQRKKHLSIEQPLFWPPGYWALFVCALTTEWVLRKRFQLR